MSQSWCLVSCLVSYNECSVAITATLKQCKAVVENYLHTEATTLEGTFLLICRKSAPFSCLSRLIYMGLHFLCTHITTYCVRVSTMETGHWHSAGHWELRKTWEPGLNYLVHCAWCWQLFLPLEKSMLRYLCLVCDTGNVVMFDPHYVQLPDWLYCCNFPLCTWDMTVETPVGHHSDRELNCEYYWDLSNDADQWPHFLIQTRVSDWVSHRLWPVHKQKYFPGVMDGLDPTYCHNLNHHVCFVCAKSQWSLSSIETQQIQKFVWFPAPLRPWLLHCVCFVQCRSSQFWPQLQHWQQPFCEKTSSRMNLSENIIHTITELSLAIRRDVVLCSIEWASLHHY